MRDALGTRSCACEITTAVQVKPLGVPRPSPGLTSILHVTDNPAFVAGAGVTCAAPSRTRTSGKSSTATSSRTTFETETETEHDLTYHILHLTPRRTSECANQEIPPALDELIAKCVEKDPANRPPNLNDVRDVLDQVAGQLTLDRPANRSVVASRSGDRRRRNYRAWSGGTEFRCVNKAKPRGQQCRYRVVGKTAPAGSNLTTHCTSRPHITERASSITSPMLKGGPHRGICQTRLP